MAKKINLKTKTLYMGMTEPEEENGQLIHFAYSSNATDKELDTHFRNVVYRAEYGIKIHKHERVDIYEIRAALDYGSAPIGKGKRNYKITLQ